MVGFRKVNPVAKAMALSRRRSMVVPDKTKHNRRKEKDHARQERDAYVRETSSKEES
jgi:hypothetical protein